MPLQVPFSSGAHAYTHITRTTWTRSILKCPTYDEISPAPSFLALPLTSEIESERISIETASTVPLDGASSPP